MRGTRWTLGSYRAASFLSAFLLFLVQPMASKALLPPFGGSFVVWGAAMVFFQAVLLIGYAYAHVIQRQVGVRRYSRLHMIVLLLPALAFPFNLSEAGQAVGRMPLVFGVIVGLLKTVGWPFLALSTSSLILQRWLSQSSLPQKANPYTLYAWSNLGSILGLLAYPFVLEPLLPLRQQEYVWWAGYAALLILHAGCLHSIQPTAGTEEPAVAKVPLPVALRWIALSAVSCAALLAVTNVITFDVASVPFLWVLPLCVYLVCFVLTFKQRIWCPHWVRPLLVWLAVFATVVRLTAALRLAVPVWLSIPFHLLLLFALCLECSAALVRSRPEHADRLTTFYLVIAAGGLLGSLIVTWCIPLIATTLVEYGLSVAAAIAAVGIGAQRADARPALVRFRGAALAAVLVVASLTLLPLAAHHVLAASVAPNLTLVVCAVPLALVLRRYAHRPGALSFLLAVSALAMQWTEPLFAGARQLHRHRNYYGIYKVYVQDGMRYLQHGTTQHGRQYLAGPKRDLALAYYHPTTPGAGVLMSPSLSPRHIGMIGLGAGSFAAYLHAGQSLTVYELDPDNLPLAKEFFDYLGAAERRGVQLRYRFGDGRVSLREEPAHALDVLIVDAFNSGSIPVHLLTVEAVREYLRSLDPHGIILFHISNKVLDLAPVVYNVAGAVGVYACEKALMAPATPDADATWWMALTPDADRLRLLMDELRWRQSSRPATPGAPWTDQYCNVLGALF